MRHYGSLQLQRLQAEADAADADVKTLELRLQNVTAAGQLAGLVTDRASAGSYRSQLGVMTHIREDFEHMAALLAQAAAEPQLDAATGPGDTTGSESAARRAAQPEGQGHGEPAPSGGCLLTGVDNGDYVELISSLGETARGEERRQRARVRATARLWRHQLKYVVGNRSQRKDRRLSSRPGRQPLLEKPSSDHRAPQFWARAPESAG
jgi:hypothetical protein